MSELQKGAQDRVQRCAQNQDKPVTESPLQRAKVDMVIALERGIAQELERNLDQFGEAIDRVQQGTRQRLAKLDATRELWNDRVGKIIDTQRESMQKARDTLASEWRTHKPRSTVQEMVDRTTRDAPLTEQILRSSELHEGHQSGTKDVRVKAELASKIAQAAVRDMASSDDRMDVVLMELEGVKADRERMLTGGEESVDSLRMIEAKKGILEAEALALANRRARMYGRLTDALREESSFSSVEGGDEGVGQGSRTSNSEMRAQLLKKAHRYEAQLRSNQTVEWRLRDVLDSELSDAKADVLSMSADYLAKIRDQAGRSLEEKIDRLHQSFVGPMKSLERDASFMEKQGDEDVHGWERVLGGEQAIVRQHIFAKLRDAHPTNM